MTEIELAKALGKAIRARREQLGYSQEAFAGEIEMHRTYYGAVERGNKNLQLDTLLRLSTGLKTTVWDLFDAAKKVDR